MAKATKKASATRKKSTAKKATTKKAAAKRTTAKKPKTVSAARSKAVAPKKRSVKSAKVAAAASTKAMQEGLEFSNNLMQNLLSPNAADASATKEQLMSIGKEGAAQVAKTADKASKSLNDMMALGKDNVDTCVQCSNIAVGASKTLGAELFNYANQSFSQNVELSKELFGCRTLNDMFDLQSKVVKTNLDNFFSESVKVSEMAFKCASEVSEPLNERVSEAAELINKTLSDAA